MKTIHRNENLNVALKTEQTQKYLPQSLCIKQSLCNHHFRHVIQCSSFHFINFTLQSGYSFQFFLGVTISRYTPLLLNNLQLMLNIFMTLLKKFFCPLQETKFSLKFSYYLMFLFENCTFASKFTDISLELQKNTMCSLISRKVVAKYYI